MDVSDPANPSLVSNFDPHPVTPEASSVLEVEGDRAMLSRELFGGANLHVIDVSDPAAPSLTSTLNFAYAGDLKADGDLLYHTTFGNLDVRDVLREPHRDPRLAFGRREHRRVGRQPRLRRRRQRQ